MLEITQVQVRWQALAVVVEVEVAVHQGDQGLPEILPQHLLLKETAEDLLLRQTPPGMEAQVEEVRAEQVLHR